MEAQARLPAVRDTMIALEREAPVAWTMLAKGIEFAYRSAKKATPVAALKDFDVSVAQGEFLSIVGPSGCGKSTFLRLAAGLERPDKGTLLFRDRPIPGPSPERGMLFQSYALFPWKTVWENAEFGPRARGIPKARRQETVERYLRQVGLLEDSHKYPHELSGGMQQRAALARLYANEPDLMLMDEPFGAVDAQTRILLQEDLLRLWQAERRTVVFVTHSVEEAVFLADRVAVMTAGPGRVKEIARIPIARPRDASARRTPEFHELMDRLSEMLRPEIRAD